MSKRIGKEKSKGPRNLQVKMSSINIIESNLRAPIKVKSPKYNFDITVDSKADSANNLVLIKTKIVLRLEDSDNLMGSIIVDYIFQFEDFSGVVEFSNKKAAKINEDIVLWLGTIAVSTSRGILYERFRGTHLGGAILPMIDMSNFKKAPKDQKQ